MSLLIKSGTLITASETFTADIRVEGEAVEARSRQLVGRHDIQHTTTFRLEEGRPVHLGYSWEGGLAVSPFHLELDVPPGNPSLGVRILDFTRDAEGWTLVMEGDGGRAGTVLLMGEAVQADDGAVSERVLDTGRATLEVNFPDTGARVIRTVRLKPTAPGNSS